jgi:hypothetical protein
MKKFKIPILIGFLPVLLSSCVVWSSHTITGNPVGTKVGYVKSSLTTDFDAGIGAAAKSGKISKISTVDVKLYMSGKMSVRVTGE